MAGYARSSSPTLFGSATRSSSPPLRVLDAGLSRRRGEWFACLLAIRSHQLQRGGRKPCRCVCVGRRRTLRDTTDRVSPVLAGVWSRPEVVAGRRGMVKWRLWERLPTDGLSHCFRWSFRLAICELPPNLPHASDRARPRTLVAANLITNLSRCRTWTAVGRRSHHFQCN